MTLGGNLPAARLAAGAIADAAADRQTALVLYAGDAYEIAPFVTDTAIIKRLLSGVASETVPDFGSRPSRGLRLAHHILKDQSIVQADIVLISDGGRFNKAALDETAALAKDGYIVHTVFVPATDSLPVFAPLPDRPSLDRVAQIGGGIAGAVNDLDPLVQRLKVSTAERLTRTSFGALAWFDLGRYLLLLALLPALFLFARAK
jgi:Ca-activated chloride channel family protein